MAEAQPSEELRAFMLRLYEVWANDDFETLREMFSAKAYLLIIGTDPNEWWTGPHQLDVWEIQNKEFGGAKFEAGKLTAYAMGNVGWIADDPRVSLGTGAQFQCRLTAVAAIERGHWRIVHWHASTAQRNEETVGIALTTSIEKLEKSVREDRPNLAPASAPDGTVTIAFTDIESSTVLMERIGDAAFLRLLAWHDVIVRDAAAEHRGFVVKSQGDGFMLAFPSAAAALRAILVMRQRMSQGYDGLPVRIRSGLHSGEAIKHDDDFYGRTVVIAARIGGLALGGEILASDLVYALARGLGTFTFGESRRAPLKGLEGTFELFPVLS
jgi:class 3 adenylate cyclase